ncbi:hypothetical protein [Frigoriglobus tundricola]|uniref:hypothetical protein n=1 Tax=Frigoriglobus tundricola TaxID=2774151 RepID=UPI00148EBEEF|nr:hypothetical protein [Frigoriglobus tundricola]
MPASPWLALRQAQEAVSAGRPDDAHRLLEPLLTEGHRRAYRMAREVVKAYTARARQALDAHNPDAAWRDLLAAEALNTGEKSVADLRQVLSRLALVQVRAMLESGRPIDAIDQISRSRERGVRHPELEQLEGAAQDWAQAAELADRGEFLRAAAELDRVEPKLPSPRTGLDRYRAEVAGRHARFSEAVARLYDAAEAKRWREAMDTAAEVLAVAPDHREAKAIRGKAWVAAAPETIDFAPLEGRRPRPTPARPWKPAAARWSRSARRGSRRPAPSAPPRSRAARRSRRTPVRRSPSGFCSGWTAWAGTSCACRAASRSGRRPRTARWTCRCSRRCRGRTPRSPATARGT